MTEEQAEAKPGGILPEPNEEEVQRKEKRRVRRRKPKHREKVQ